MLDTLLRRASPAYRIQRKEQAELAFWQNALAELRSWYDGKISFWGTPPLQPERRHSVSDHWVVNAITIRHGLRPTYHEALQLDRDAFRGKRVLEVGCGPMAPILQFADCDRHGVDPLVNVYMFAGWPLYAYDVKCVSTKAESLPYPDGYFDAIISVNALDHVHDFEQVCSEIERVLRPGGEVHFEVEYHKPTVTEPVMLHDHRMHRALPGCKLSKILRRSAVNEFSGRAV